MLIAAWTVAVLGVASVLLYLFESIVLHIYYAALAVLVFITAVRSKYYLFIFLGTLLFARFFLENYEYDWSTMPVLSIGHLLLAILAFLLVRISGQRYLYYFPVLILGQALADVFYMVFGEVRIYSIIYKNIHNILAVMQMVAFIVWARQAERLPTTPEPGLTRIVDSWLSFAKRIWAGLNERA